MSLDANAIVARARARQERLDYQSALELFLYLAQGDQSLDGGSLGVDIAYCYEQLGRINEARFWASRAREENPTLDDRVEISERLGPIKIEHLL